MHHPEVANTLNNLGILLKDLGDFAGARPLHERALAIYESVFGSHHLDVAFSLQNLGAVMVEMGEFEPSRPLFERIISGYGTHHQLVARARFSLAKSFALAGLPNDARPLLQHVLEIQESVQGVSKARLLETIDLLSSVCSVLGHAEEALALQVRAAAIRT